jgi:hypothetical protein
MMVTDNRNFHHRKFTQLTRVRVKTMRGDGGKEAKSLRRIFSYEKKEARRKVNLWLQMLHIT